MSTPALTPHHPRMTYRAARVVCALAAVILAAACSTKPVVPPSEFPAPVLRPVPLNVGLYMDETFRSYVHHDAPAKGVKQDVSVGPASRSLFTDFLRAQFQGLTVLEQPPGAGRAASVQAVLQPDIQDVQIASPKSDKDAFYEAWIKYRLRLLAPDGREITSWDLAAYGKDRSRTMGTSNAGLTAAVRDAMRDAAAGMALLFRDGAAVRERVLAASTPAPAAPATLPPGSAP